MPANKVMNLRLRNLMKILELVHSAKLNNVQPIRQDSIRFPLQKMLSLVRRDMAHSSEHISTMCSTSFDAVTMVDTTLSSFVINVEIGEVVVEVYAAGTEISTEERGVGCEYRCEVYVTFSAEGDCEACLPFVEVGDDGCVELMRDVLHYTISFEKLLEI